MADNKKYYYLKLKDDFFETDEMIVLESMKDGYIYSNILLKMYVRSLKNDGRLMFKANIPFSPEMLASITRHSVGDIVRAVDLFETLGLIEKMDGGAIYMTDIQKFIGKSSSEGDRKREYRNRIAAEKEGAKTIDVQIKEKIEKQVSKKCPDKSGTSLRQKSDMQRDICPSEVEDNSVYSGTSKNEISDLDKCPKNRPPEIEIEIEKEIDRANIAEAPMSKRSIKKIEKSLYTSKYFVEDGIRAIVNYRKAIKHPIKTQVGYNALEKKIKDVMETKGLKLLEVLDLMGEKEWRSIEVDWIKDIPSKTAMAGYHV